MSTLTLLTLLTFLVDLLSIAVPAVAILSAFSQNEFIRNLGRKNIFLQSLMRNNPDFGKFYNKFISSLSPWYFILLLSTMVILAFISLFFVNIRVYEYVDMVVIIFLAFTVISIFSFVLYFKIKRYKTSTTAEKEVEKFKKEWRLLAALWVIVVTFYIIPALNFDNSSLFYFNYELQNFIWFEIPLVLVFLSIILFLFGRSLSRDLIWGLINKKLAEKSLQLEIYVFINGIDGKIESIHGFVINLGRYVKLETEKTFETLRYADIHRIEFIKGDK